MLEYTVDEAQDLCVVCDACVMCAGQRDARVHGGRRTRPTAEEPDSGCVDTGPGRGGPGISARSDDHP